jgi:hypothetical protein
MSKVTLDQEQDMGDVYDTEISDEDYGFILGPDGELKSVFLPDNMPFKQPKNIRKIFKMFGINDAEQLDDPTLH